MSGRDKEASEKRHLDGRPDFEARGDALQWQDETGKPIFSIVGSRLRSFAPRFPMLAAQCPCLARRASLVRAQIDIESLWEESLIAVRGITRHAIISAS